jgi:hypothetical protein
MPVLLSNHIVACLTNPPPAGLNADISAELYASKYGKLSKWLKLRKAKSTPIEAVTVPIFEKAIYLLAEHSSNGHPPL